jgi:hypothetical protein
LRDKVSVTFQLGVAFGVAIATAVVLTWMGIRNQQSGWRRQRSNTILDILYAWAAANAEMRITTSEAPRQQPAAQPTMESQLSALHAALTPNAGVSPQVDSVVHSQVVTTPASRG